MLFKKSALVFAASLLAMGAAHAVPPTATSSTDATACTVGATIGAGPINMNLAYSSGSVVPESNSSSSFSVVCNGSNTVSYSIEAGSGNNASASSRRALFSGNYVDYQLLAGPTPLSPVWDAATTAFGGTVISGSTTVTGATSAASLMYSVKVPANQTAPTGTYTDTVLLTATF
jgi:spore coat protein U-like protein